METIFSPQEMTERANSLLAASETIALVPTMGFFHDGHLALMRKAAELADKVVVSLFVNPIQFGPEEDLAKYPRNFDRDAEMARQTGVDFLFTPEAAHMYPGVSLTKVTVAGLTDFLCGRSRPGHFEGVTTVVAKLFNIVKPGVAVFGRKDFQQLAVIRKMVRDLNWDIKIEDHPIVRENDGLAMSSRNTYLSSGERDSALCLHQAVKLARKRVRSGVVVSAQLITEITSLIQSFGNVVIEYVSIVDQDSLTDVSVIDKRSVLALAVRIGTTRLIDNDFLFEGE